MNEVKYQPLYMQVRKSLLKNIVDGEYIHNQPLPTESILADSFGTSISTIRQALSTLVSDGVLVRKQGKGTFLSDSKKRISFFTWIPETPKGEQSINELVKRIEKKHPNLAVDIVTTTYPKAKETLANLIASGNAPDIAQIVSHWTSYFATTGAFETLENFLPENHLALRPHIKDMEGGIYQNKLYSVAWGYAPLSMIMNKKILKKAGFAEHPSPMTLNDFSDICTKIQTTLGSENIKPYAISTSREEADFLRLYPFLQAFGGRLIDDNNSVVLDSEENIRAFKWLRELHENHDLFYGDIYSIRQAFAEGKIAFITDGPWIKLWLEELTGCPFDENFDVVLNPVFSAPTSISWNYNHALAICSQSHNKIYAGEFIDSITMDPDIAGWYYRQVGQLPITEKDIKAISSEEPFFRIFAEQLKGSQCLKSENALFEKALEFCIDAVQKILFEGADVRKELTEKEYYLNILYR